jgi:hypothetical protein
MKGGTIVLATRVAMVILVVVMAIIDTLPPIGY